jgi:hypothetical protein
MDFVSGYPTTQWKHDWIFEVLYKFLKKLVFVTCHNTIGASKVVKLLF